MKKLTFDDTNLAVSYINSKLCESRFHDNKTDVDVYLFVLLGYSKALGGAIIVLNRNENYEWKQIIAGSFGYVLVESVMQKIIPGKLTQECFKIIELYRERSRTPF